MVEIKEKIDKEVKIFPYKCDITPPDNKIEDFKELFKIENSDTNVIEYMSGIYLVLVIDECYDGFMFGRLFKLRDDSPTIFNKKEGKEREIDLLSEENIKEESHFIWNIKDSIIFAEYNFSAIRMFSSPLSGYLNEKFNIDDCKVVPIQDKNTFTNLKKEEIIYSLNMKIAQDKSKSLQDQYNLPDWKILFDIGEDNETFFEVSVKRSRKKDSKLDKDKVINIVGNLIEKKAQVDSIKVETQDIVYDLIKNNLVFYYINVKKEGRNLDKTDFNFKTLSLYKKHIDTIKSNLKTSNTSKSTTEHNTN